MSRIWSEKGAKSGKMRRDRRVRGMILRLTKKTYYDMIKTTKSHSPKASPNALTKALGGREDRCRKANAFPDKRIFCQERYFSASTTERSPREPSRRRRQIWSCSRSSSIPCEKPFAGSEFSLFYGLFMSISHIRLPRGEPILSFLPKGCGFRVCYSDSSETIFQEETGK